MDIYCSSIYYLAIFMYDAYIYLFMKTMELNVELPISGQNNIKNEKKFSLQTPMNLRSREKHNKERVIDQFEMIDSN